MTATIDDLKARVQALLEQSKLAGSYRGFAIETAGTYGDDEILRVFISVDHPERISTDGAMGVINDVVEDLLEVDDRFPSVRFAEAA